MPKKHRVYRKDYAVRKIGLSGYQAQIPILVLERAAESAGMSVDEFIKEYRMEHLFNDFTEFNAAYRFVKKNEPDEVIEVPEIA